MEVKFVREDLDDHCNAVSQNSYVPAMVLYLLEDIPEPKHPYTEPLVLKVGVESVCNDPYRPARLIAPDYSPLRAAILAVLSSVDLVLVNGLDVVIEPRAYSFQQNW
jgi:hypothetical protein